MADSVEPLFLSLDPASLILSQNSDCQELRLTVGDFLGFERGPRYGEYARLREAKLLVKRDFEKILEEEEQRFSVGDEPRKKIPATRQVRFGDDLVINSRGVEKNVLGKEDRVSPEKKQVTFGTKSVNLRKKSVSSSASMLAQSVPDFSAMIRKENRIPTNLNALSRPVELTPQPSKGKNSAVSIGSASSARGSKSASAGEKKSKGLGLARKSYASVEDLRKISMAAATAINGSGGGGRRAAGGGRTILGYRQLY